MDCNTMLREEMHNEGGGKRERERGGDGKG